MGKKKPQSTRAVLITGGGRRIGRAMALDLARDGWSVAIHYRNSQHEAEQVVAEICRNGGRAEAIVADLTNRAQVETLIPRAAAALGPLTCLINNASTFEMDTIESMTPESWDAHMEANLRAPMALIQAFARQCPSGAESPVVINMLEEVIGEFPIDQRRLYLT